MLVLGIQGSPRKNGNTAALLSVFMKEAARKGLETITISPYDYNISPCLEYTACERTGSCPIKDDVETVIYPLMRRAGIIVTASPAFFYAVPSRLKALIDRTQPLWSRKYRLGLDDPLRNVRKGFFLGVGATKGKRLFEGMDLTMRYFYDAAGASYEGMLGYRGIEKPGDIKKHPDVENDVRTEVAKLLKPFTGRKKIAFVCRDGSFSGPAAYAFAMKESGDVYDAEYFGIRTDEKINPMLESLMAKRGIDTGFMNPQPVNSFFIKNSDCQKIFIGENESEAAGFDFDVFWKIPGSGAGCTDPDAILEAVAEKIGNLTTCNKKILEEMIMEKYECSVCGYIYDPENGDPGSDVPPGTPFDELTDNWACPVCGATRSLFEKK